MSTRTLNRVFTFGRMDAIHRIRSVVVGTSLGLSRGCFLLSLVLFMAWSYSIWGSKSSPLAVLLTPAMIFLVVSLIIRITIDRWLVWVRRMHQCSLRREKRRLSRQSKQCNILPVDE